MAVSHNVYIRGINAIYQHANHISLLGDKADFLLFCQIWIEVISHHHCLEEEIFFPRLEVSIGTAGLMKENIEQHKKFHDALHSFQEYLKNSNAETYDGKIIRGHIEEFGQPLVLHLHDEINSLLALKRYVLDGSIAKRAFKAFE